MVKFRKHFDYDVVAASDEAALQPDKIGVSLTVQSQAEDTDINVMLKRFGVLGTIQQGVRAPEYGDFSNVTDFRTAMHAVMEAQNSFNAMPAEVRARFANDPQLFVEFCSDPKNVLEMESLGLTNSMMETEKKKIADARVREEEIEAAVRARAQKSS